MFQNSKIGTLTRENYSHYYNNNIESKWTPIETIIKDIRVGKSQSFIITKIQFPIQLVTTRTIYRSQRLSLYELVFDPTNVKKHGLNIYNIIPHLNKRKMIYVSSSPTWIFLMWIQKYM